MAALPDDDPRRALLRFALGASIWCGALVPPDPGDERPRAVTELQALAVKAAQGIDEISALGAAARNAVDDLRTSAISASPEELLEIDALSGPLHAEVNDAVTAKVVQLESEAVNIDALLQLALAELPDVCSLARDLTTDKRGLIVELRGRVNAVLARLRVVPRCLQTDTTLRVFALAAAAAGGALAALRSAVIVTETAPPADVLFSAPTGSQRRRIRPGTAVLFRLSATDAAAARLHHDADAFIAAIVQRVAAVATLAPPMTRGSSTGAPRETIPVEASVAGVRDTASGIPFVEVSLPVPAEAPLGSTLALHSLTLAAVPLLPKGGVTFTVVPSVGLRVPMEVPRLCVSRNQTPCTSSDGSLWVPLVAEVRRVAEDGTTLATLPTTPIGLSGMLCASFDPATGLLVLASQDAGQPLVAVHAATGKVAWRAAEAPGAVFGLVVLSTAGVVVVGGHSAAPNAVSVHRLLDGARLGTASVRGLTYLAADSVSGTIFASTYRGAIEVLRWDGRALLSLEPLRLVPHLPGGTSHNPLCVMPDAEREGGPPTLIVGVQEATDILVFSLDASGIPVALIKKQRLATGIEVVGLAADPSGCGIVVMDWSSHAVRVLPWPLTREFLRQ